MARRKKVETTPEQGYPTLREFVCGRRQFLRKLVLGAAAVGASRVLSGCYSTSERDDRDLLDVRLPATGFATMILDAGEHLRYAVVISTYNAALAEYFRSNAAEGITAINEETRGYSCGDFTGEMRRARRAFVLALEGHYTRVFDDSGPLIDSLDLIVESCEISTEIGGVAPYPGYP